jgi:hypothetical protein
MIEHPVGTEIQAVGDAFLRPASVSSFAVRVASRSVFAKTLEIAMLSFSIGR